MKILHTYGSHAKPFIPELLEISRTFDKGEEGFPGQLSKQKAEMLREGVKVIEAAQDGPELIRIR